MFCVKCGTEFEGKFCPNCGTPAPQKRFCPRCGAEITDPKVTICEKCNSYVPPLKEEMKGENKTSEVEQPKIIINNVNTNTNSVTPVGFPKAKNKWVALLLCVFLGILGAHKFYEGKYLMGILYIFTFGLFFIGWFADCIALLFKPNPYYV